MFVVVCDSFMLFQKVIRNKLKKKIMKKCFIGLEEEAELWGLTKKF